MKNLIIAILLFSMNTFLDAAATGRVYGGAAGAAAGGPDEDTVRMATPITERSVFTQISNIADSQVEDFTYFDVYAAIADIAIVQGHKYDDYSSLSAHPGQKKTMALMQSLLEAIIKKEKDELDYRRELYEKLLALDPADHQNKEAYERLHPFFVHENWYKTDPETWYEYFKKWSNPQPFITTLDCYRRLLVLVEAEPPFEATLGDFLSSKSLIDDTSLEIREALSTRLTFHKDINWNYFFSECLRELKNHITREPEGGYQTSSKSLLRLRQSKDYWRLIDAQREISLFSLTLALMRLSLAHVDKNTIVANKSVLIMYTLDNLLYPTSDELEEHQIGPTSIIENKLTRENRLKLSVRKKALASGAVGLVTTTIKLDLPNTPEEVALWKKIENGNHMRAMPKMASNQKTQADSAFRSLEEDLLALDFLSTSKKQPSKAARKKAAKKGQIALGTEGAAAGATAGIQEKRETGSCILLNNIAGAAKPASEEGARCADEKLTSMMPFTPQDIREKTLQLAMRMATNSDRLRLLPGKSFCPVNWVKHPSEDRYIPEPVGRFNLTHAQNIVLTAIREQTPFTFNMSSFLNLMVGLGIPYRGQKGSHVSIHSPGKMPKIFVDPHGGCTDKFGADAMTDMLELINGLSLGEGSPYLELES